MKSHNIEEQINFIVPIWGDEYTSLWLEFALASLLSNKNLSSCKINKEKIHFLLCVERKKVDTLKSHANMKKLEQLCKVTFIEIDDILSYYKKDNPVASYSYRCMTAAQNRAMKFQLLQNRSNHFCFFMADNVFFDGFIENLIETIYTQKPSVILVYGLHIVYENAIEELKRYQYEGVLTFTSEQISKLAMRYSHLTTAIKTFTTDMFVPHASAIFGDENVGAIMNTCILHPIYIQAETLIDETDTFDGGKFMFAQSPKDILIIDDSRKLILHSLDKRKNKDNFLSFQKSFFNEFCIAERLTKVYPQLEQFFKKRCLIYVNEDEENLKKVDSQSKEVSRVIYEIFLMLKDFNIDFPLSDVMNMDTLKEINEWKSKIEGFILAFLSKKFVINKDIDEKYIFDLLKKAEKFEGKNLVQTKFQVSQIYNLIFEHISGVDNYWMVPYRYYYAYLQFVKLSQRYKKIVVYGAGNDLRILLGLDKKLYTKVNFIVDDYRQEKIFNHIKIYPSNALLKLSDKDIIVVCSSNHGANIIKNLKAKAVKAKVVNLFPTSLQSNEAFKKTKKYQHWYNSLLCKEWTQ